MDVVVSVLGLAEGWSPSVELSRVVRVRRARKNAWPEHLPAASSA